MRAATTAAISALAIGLVGVSARAADLDASCSGFNAPIVTNYFLDGCTSPFGICTAGSVDSGLLGGTTTFTLLGLEPGDSPELLQYVGELVITTPNGVLTINDKGFLNTLDGTFFEIDQIVDGTDSFTGATGLAFSQGTSTPTGFDGIIAGHVCGPSDPPVNPSGLGAIVHESLRGDALP